MWILEVQNPELNHIHSLLHCLPSSTLQRATSFPTLHLHNPEYFKFCLSLTIRELSSWEKAVQSWSWVCKTPRSIRSHTDLPTASWRMNAIHIILPVWRRMYQPIDLACEIFIAIVLLVWSQAAAVARLDTPRQYAWAFWRSCGSQVYFSKQIISSLWILTQMNRLSSFWGVWNPCWSRPQFSFRGLSRLSTCAFGGMGHVLLVRA